MNVYSLRLDVNYSICDVADYPRCKNLLRSRVTKNKENKGEKTIETWKIIVNKNKEKLDGR